MASAGRDVLLTRKQDQPDWRGAVQSLWILWREGEGEREEKAKKKGEGSEWNKKLGLEENPW